MNDSIQQFGIPELNRKGTFSYSIPPPSHLFPLYSPIFNALKLNSSITTLDLSIWKMDDLGPLIAEVIMLNNTITHLNLSNHPFGREMMNAIRINSTIQTLNISVCGCENSMFENTRGTSSSLTNLDISGNQFDFTHVAEWLKYNVNLKSLTLSGSQIIGNARNAFCEWLPNQSTLTELQILNASDDFGGIKLKTCFKNHGKLQRFSLQDAHFSSVTEEGLLLLESLSFNRDLHYLDMSSSFRHEGYSSAIGQLIDSLSLLTELHLGYCRLNNQISEALRRNSTLKTLDLYKCFNGDDVMKVCEVLHNHPNLTWLNLGTNSSHKKTKNGVSTIAKLLQTQIHLKSLYFNNRCDDGKGMVDLVKVLKTNHALTCLSLSGVRCKDEGAIALAECLTVNTTLTQLNLANNGIEENGVKAIAQSLENNSSLKSLDLRSNYIYTNNGLAPLLKMLDINTTLTNLLIWIEARLKLEIPQRHTKRIQL